MDLDAVYARLVNGYADDPAEERLAHAIDDLSLVAAEVERLRGGD